MAANVAPGRRQVGDFSIRWDPDLAREAYDGGWWVRETLADALNQAVETSPERVLLVDGDVRVDAKTLHAQARSLANAMLERAPSGSVVSFMLPNWHEAGVIYLAATLAGMVAHPILPSLRDFDLEFMLSDLGSRMIFIPAEHRKHDYVAMLDRVAERMDKAPDVVVVRGDARSHTAYERLLGTGALRDLPEVDPDAVRLVMYTSGTTGSPKGVLHSHNSINALIRQLGQHWLLDPGDTILVPSPISHIGGSIYAFECPLLLGTSAVLMDRWDADLALQLAKAEQVTHMMGATPFLDQLLKAGRSAGESLPALKLFVCGGASVPPSLIRDAAEHFQSAAITRVYGSTEVPVTTVGCPDRAAIDQAADTDGRLGIAKVKLVNAAGTQAEEGEILARGPQMLVGYIHAEDESPVFDEEGYYRTGDLGRWVDGDCLVISGRAKDIIIRNGENISPKEVEDILIVHPDIAEVAIVGVPDPRTGERACAVIVPAREPGPGVAELCAFLKERGVAAFKFPEEVILQEELPKNDAGKVLKQKIRLALTSSRAQ